MPESYSSLRDLKRAKGSAPSQGWQGPRTKWSGAREHSSSYVDTPPPPSGASGSGGNPYAASSSGNPYASSSSSGGPYGGAQQQQNVASGIGGDPYASRTRDANSRFAERYAGQRSYSAADPVTSTAADVRAEPKRGNSWSSWLGGNKFTTTEPSAASSHNPGSHTPPGGRPGSQHSGHEDDRVMPDRPRRGRYIPPSERKPGDPMFEPVKPPPHRGPRVNEDDEPDEPDPNDNSWGAWAQRQTKAANAMMQTATDKLNEGWDSVNDANKRDKALTSVGTGAAKAAGGAVKYTAKGIWNVGKYATR